MFNGQILASDDIKIKSCRYGINFVKVKSGDLIIKNGNKVSKYPVKEFWMTESEISYRQYAKVMGDDSRIIKLNVTNDTQLDLPVGNITYFECILFASILEKRLNDHEESKMHFPTGIVACQQKFNGNM